MSKYKGLVSDILKNIGGKDNIISLTHCVTRLRFNLKEEALANDEALKQMDGVVTVMKTAGQYQVVIGNHVPEVYAEVLNQAGISGDEQVESQKKMSIFDMGIDILSGIMMPSIMILCAAGMIKGFQAMFVAFGLMSPEGSWYTLFYAIGDSMFYFFPAVLGYNAARKFKSNPYIGMMLGLILVYPTLVGQELTFFGMTNMYMYNGTVLPIIFIVAAAAPIERFLVKVIPDVVKAFLVPVIVLVIMAPLGFLFIGPIANMISAVLGLFVTSIYNISPLLAGLFLGFFWQIFVIFGVHMVIMLPSMINVLSGTPDPILPLLVVASFAQTGMVIAIWAKTKDQKLKQVAFPAWVSGVFGVTEPAIYGVTLPHKKYFIITCIVSGIGGAILGSLGAMTYQMSGMGIFTFPANIDPNGGLYSFYLVLIMCILGTLVSFIIGYIMYTDEEVTDIGVNNEELVKVTESIISPLKGEVKQLSTIEDDAFSQGLLGKGVAIEPTSGEVYAPFDGTIVTLFPTKHAIGILSNDGCEVLIHIGMDTVKLDGQYFESYIKQNDIVKQGQILIKFDIDKIKEKGYVVTTPVVITNSSDYLDIVQVVEGQIKKDEEIMKVMV